MILADKIIELRKRAGYSQEELAERLGVSRQSISKWEGAQSIPDMNKILAMADLFGVSTDYLLRDEMDMPEGAAVDPGEADEDPAVRVSMETARAYIEARTAAAPKIALGVMLCIFSPILLILLGGMQEYGIIATSEEMAGGLGLIILMAMVVIAVCIFILTGSRLSKFEFLEKQPLDTEYGVAGLCRELIERQENGYTRSMVIGVGLCVASSIPLFAAMMTRNEFYCVLGICFILLMVGIGVCLIVKANVVRDSYLVLLEEGDYTREEKRVDHRIGGIYWGIVLAGYLLVSFLTMRWEITWVVWPVAGILYGVAKLIFSKRR
ncbi:MAG: helix-turn-helix transcriptional regulator [Firmicutes bacterium]|nr:helix-turn-helix transcriptional regulator [Bacillota bacterium]